jgi:multidrug efflux pump
MLTTITTILGLLPMVLQVNLDFFERTIVFGAPSTQWWTQLATAIAGGLAFATVLTLVLTPCLLVLRDLRKETKHATTIMLKNEGSQVKEVSSAA